jgi:phosphoglycolate phosphatase
MAHTYNHIIWDWNGTLFNDIELCVDVLNGLLVRRDLPAFSIEAYKDIFTFPVKDYYAKAGLDLEKYSFEELGKEWMSEYETRRLEGKLFSSTEKVLQIINSNGIEQSILSAYKQDTLLELVNHFNLRHFFTHLTGLDHIYATSKLDLGKDLMKKLDHLNSNVLLVGDTVHDFEVAQAMNAGCILVADGHQSKEKLIGCGVDVFDNLEHVIEAANISPNGFVI